MAFFLDHVVWLVAQKAPFEQVIKALDDCVARPDTEIPRTAIEHRRVLTYCHYERPVEEVISVLDSYLAIQNDLLERADTVSLACASFPELIPKYLDPVIADLESAQKYAKSSDGLQAAAARAAMAASAATAAMAAATAAMQAAAKALEMASAPADDQKIATRLEYAREVKNREPERQRKPRPKATKSRKR